jgi:hypothetical protein
MPIPAEIFGVPSWIVIVVVLAIIIITGLVIYKKLTAYTPQQQALVTDEPSVTTNFDPNAIAQAANNVFSSTFGSNAPALVAQLSALDDNELIEVYNAYNAAYFSTTSQTLTQELQSLDFVFTSSVPRNNLVARMQAAPLNLA